MKKCLKREFDDEGRMFFCALAADHTGPHYREVRIGYRRAYVRDANGTGQTFYGLRRPRP